MEWTIDPKVHALVSPNLVRAHRVLPLGEEAGRVRLVYAHELTESARREKEELLEFILGRPVTLYTIDAFPEIGSGFDEIVDFYYGTPFPEALSQPVARQVATVLLLDPEGDRRAEHRARLEGFGFFVVEASSTDDAVRELKAWGEGITQMLLPTKGWSGEKEARRRLSAVADAPMSRVDRLLADCQAELTQV